MARLHLIGNSHIDPVWLWRWQEGFDEIVATYRSALDRLKDFDDLKFTSACASYYQWIEKIDKDMFEEIRQRVAEGRWEITGGWFLQPDCNIPCGESFVRHGLFGQRYFKEKFGIIAKTAYNVDSFGHNASLPQIFKKSGMDNYVFLRPMPYEKKMDADVFRWESSDGSCVNVHRILQTYCLGREEGPEVFFDQKAKADESGQDRMAFFGIGNHGGGPTIKLIDDINHLGIADMKYSTTNEYFESIDVKSLPLFKGELQHHARGCYSVNTFAKKNNRKCENNLLAAEKFCSMANYLTNMKYPKAKLDKAWKNLMFNQFHDILCGCSIKKAYEDADYLYGETMSITEQVIYEALKTISLEIDTLKGENLPVFKSNRSYWKMWEHEVLGTPVVVFNPHTWSVRKPVQVNAYAKKMTDDKGEEIPFQLVRGDYINGRKDRYHTVFMAEIEPFGYRVYRLFLEHESQSLFKKEVSITETVLENNKIRVEFSRQTGDISKLYDKQSQKHIIKRECGAILLDETSADTWAHDKVYLGEKIGEFDRPEFILLEEGSVRSTLRVITYCGDSVLQRDYSIVHNSDVVTVKVKVDFREKHRTLKLTFPTVFEEVISEIPYGAIRREKGSGEEVCGSWFAAGDLCVANDSKYAYDSTNSEVRMTVLRSAIYADAGGNRDAFCEYIDMGIHEFTYQLFPYRSDSDSTRRAGELNSDLRVVMESFHKGSLPEQQSLFECKEDHVIVTAIKKAEDSDAAVIRFYESEGRSGAVSMNIFDKVIQTTISHNEIKTYTSDGTEVNLIEW